MSPKRQDDSFASIRRMIKIHLLLQAGRRLTAEEIQERINNQKNIPEQQVSLRTIQRDLKELPKLFGIKVDHEFDGHSKRFYYNKGSMQLKTIYSDTELLIMAIAKQLSTMLPENDVILEAQKIFKKVRSGRCVSISSPRGQGINAPMIEFYWNELVKEIEKAYQKGTEQNQSKEDEKVPHVIKIDYHTAATNTVNEREIEPYHLRQVDGLWYLIAYCLKRNDWRVFALDRIQYLEVTDQAFIPRKFDIKTFLNRCWAIEKEKDPKDKIYHIKAIFSKEQAPYIRGRIWHESQRIKEHGEDPILGKDEILFEADVNGLKEIQRWFLGFGKHVRILEPQKLVDLIQAEALEITKQRKTDVKG